MPAAGDVSWRSVLAALVEHRDLGSRETEWAMDQILSGDTPDGVLGAFLATLRAKGETVDEISGLVDAMLAHAQRIEVPRRSVDVVGTGGDGAHTVNISTMAAIVVAACSVTVVKHGNRAASSLTGTADVLAELGVRLDLTPDRVADVASEVGITFCFAPVFHPAMRHAGPVRKQLAIPTTFNVLGPLTNPAQPAASAIGVASAALAPLVAQVLATKGREGLVFRNDDGLDELAATASASVWEVRDGAVVQSAIDARQFGLARISIADLRGGEAPENARVVREVLAGMPGAIRETVLLNAAAGLVAEASTPGTVEGSLSDRLQAGLSVAASAVDSGRAADLLDRWAAATQA